jgi:hypothetical protein
MATVKRLEQHQVPDGMVANIPWGQPLERWSDKMVERGLKYLDGSLDRKLNGEGSTYFPKLFASMGAEARERGIEV